jgi:ABC-type amino acid transport substrate-binding protein
MKVGIIKKIIAVVAVSTIAISMVGCGSTAKKEDTNKNVSALQSIKSKGKLVIGTSADFPPYEFHSTANGSDEIVGIDIDIAKQVAQDLGVELEVKDMDFDGLLVDLQADKVDMVFSGMTPTAERKENVDFSDMYYTVKQTFIVRSGEEAAIKSVDDLKTKKIGVQKGSVQEGMAKDLFSADNIKSLAKVTDLVLDLKNSKVDAILLETPVADFNAKKNEGVALTSVVLEDPDGGYAIAMKKGQSDLQAEVNKSIKKLQDENKIADFAIKASELMDK